MAKLPPILATAQAQFPKSANKGVRVIAGWNPEKATTGKSHPEPGGMDGWETHIDYATFEAISRLKKRGCTWVNLEAGGTANSRKDVPISSLI